MRGLDRYITGNYGEDQLRSFCADCGATYHAEETMREAALDDNGPEACSETCAPCYRKRREREVEAYVDQCDGRKESHPDDWTPRPRRKGNA
jgi:uncharacterized protein YutD